MSSNLKKKFNKICNRDHRVQTRVKGDFVEVLNDLLSALSLDPPFVAHEWQALYIVNKIVTRDDSSVERIAECYATIPKPRIVKIRHAEGVRNHMALARASLRNHGLSLDAASASSAIVNEYLNSREVRKFSDKHFYRSREWREVRLAVLEANRKCKKCGKTPLDGIVLHVDHIKPRSIYPELSLSIDNLQVLCSECNTTKSNLVSI